MNGITLSIRAVTPPDGLRHTDRKTEILELPQYLNVAAAPDANELALVYVSAAEPGPNHRDKIWIKTDELNNAHGMFIYQNGVWRRLAGPGIIAQDSQPTDQTCLWLRTSATYNNCGLYRYTGGAWVLVAGPAILVQDTEPTNKDALWFKTTSHTDGTGRPRGLYRYSSILSQWLASNGLSVSPTAPTAIDESVWMKTTDTTSIRGVYVPSGGAWELLAAPGERRVIVSGTAPAAALRANVMWAKNTGRVRGMFWADTDNGYWESVTPIAWSARYPSAGSAHIDAKTYTFMDVPYASMFALGTAYFAEIPAVSVMIDSDSLYDADPISPLHYVVLLPDATKISFSMNTADARDIAIRVAISGIMRIPF